MSDLKRAKEQMKGFLRRDKLRLYEPPYTTEAGEASVPQELIERYASEADNLTPALVAKALESLRLTGVKRKALKQAEKAEKKKAAEASAATTPTTPTAPEVAAPEPEVEAEPEPEPEPEATPEPEPEPEPEPVVEENTTVAELFSALAEDSAVAVVNPFGDVVAEPAAAEPESPAAAAAALNPFGAAAAEPEPVAEPQAEPEADPEPEPEVEADPAPEPTPDAAPPPAAAAASAKPVRKAPPPPGPPAAAAPTPPTEVPAAPSEEAAAGLSVPPAESVPTSPEPEEGGEEDGKKGKKKHKSNPFKRLLKKDPTANMVSFENDAFFMTKAMEANRAKDAEVEPLYFDQLSADEQAAYVAKMQQEQMAAAAAQDSSDAEQGTEVTLAAAASADSLSEAAPAGDATADAPSAAAAPVTPTAPVVVSAEAPAVLESGDAAADAAAGEDQDEVPDMRRMTTGSVGGTSYKRSESGKRLVLVGPDGREVQPGEGASSTDAKPKKRGFQFRLSKKRSGTAGTTNLAANNPFAVPPKPIKSEFKAHELQMTDDQRIEVMSMVKHGKLTIDEAIKKVLETEQALRTGAEAGANPFLLPDKTEGAPAAAAASGDTEAEAGDAAPAAPVAPVAPKAPVVPTSPSTEPTAAAGDPAPTPTPPAASPKKPALSANNPFAVPAAGEDMTGKIRAGDIKLPDADRLAIMVKVKEGKISVEEAVDEVLAAEKALQAKVAAGEAKPPEPVVAAAPPAAAAPTPAAPTPAPPAKGKSAPSSPTKAAESDKSRVVFSDSDLAFMAGQADAPKLRHSTLDRPKNKSRPPSRALVREKWQAKIEGMDDIGESTTDDSPEKPVKKPRKKPPAPGAVALPSSPPGAAPKPKPRPPSAANTAGQGGEKRGKSFSLFRRGKDKKGSKTDVAAAEDAPAAATASEAAAPAPAVAKLPASPRKTPEELPDPIGRARVVTTCKAGAYDEETLEVEEGAIVNVLQRRNTDVWYCEHEGAAGDVKFIYLEMLEEFDESGAPAPNGPPQPPADLGPDELPVIEFLVNIGMQEHARLFEEQGFDVVEDLKGLTSEELESIGIASESHRDMVLGGVEKRATERFEAVSAHDPFTKKLSEDDLQVTGSDISGAVDLFSALKQQPSGSGDAVTAQPQVGKLPTRRARHRKQFKKSPSDSDPTTPTLTVSEAPVPAKAAQLLGANPHVPKELKAADMMMSDEQRLQVMQMVKDGQLSVEQAMDKVLAVEELMKSTENLATAAPEVDEEGFVIVDEQHKAIDPDEPVDAFEKVFKPETEGDDKSSDSGSEDEDDADGKPPGHDGGKIQVTINKDGKLEEAPLKAFQLSVKPPQSPFPSRRNIQPQATAATTDTTGAEPAPAPASAAAEPEPEPAQQSEAPDPFATPSVPPTGDADKAFVDPFAAAVSSEAVPTDDAFAAQASAASAADDSDPFAVNSPTQRAAPPSGFNPFGAADDSFTGSSSTDRPAAEPASEQPDTAPAPAAAPVASNPFAVAAAATAPKPKPAKPAKAEKKSSKPVSLDPVERKPTSKHSRIYDALNPQPLYYESDEDEEDKKKKAAAAAAESESDSEEEFRPPPPPGENPLARARREAQEANSTFMRSLGIKETPAPPSPVVQLRKKKGAARDRPDSTASNDSTPSKSSDRSSIVSLHIDEEFMRDLDARRKQRELEEQQRADELRAKFEKEKAANDASLAEERALYAEQKRQEEIAKGLSNEEEQIVQERLNTLTFDFAFSPNTSAKPSPTPSRKELPGQAKAAPATKKKPPPKTLPKKNSKPTVAPKKAA